jgi:hypothetical protein
MSSLANPSQERTGEEPTEDATWRLRWYVGDLAHHTAWTSDFATVENLYDQYRRSEVHPGSDYVIERRTEVGADPEEADR